MKASAHTKWFCSCKKYNIQPRDHKQNQIIEVIRIIVTEEVSGTFQDENIEDLE